MRCSRCGRELPEDSFAWAKKGERRHVTCRECFKAYNAKRYQRKRKEIKTKVAEYRERNPDTVFNTRLKACKKNPTKYNANKLIEAALKAGRLVKPHECSICGCSDIEHRIEAHHEDYAHPLDIVWACTPCHRKMDAERRVREGAKAYPTAVAVQQIDDDGNVVARYESCAAAAAAVHRAPSSIFQALNKDGRCAGYRWKREEQHHDQAL